MKFKELKEEILRRAKEAGACEYPYKCAYKSKNRKELFQVVKKEFSWCYSNKVIDSELLDAFGENHVNNEGIYYKGDIERIEGKEVIALCGNVVVGVLDSSTVQEMWGSSTVQKMLDSSTVQKMWGSSTVQEMLGSSTVQKMLDSSTVQEMWGSSTVQKMLDSSTVQKMWDSSTVQKMWGSSTVQEMLGSSTVQEMWGSSTVQEMWGSSTVQKMWGSSTVQEMLDSSTVQEMLDSSTVQEMWDSSTVRSNRYNGDLPEFKSELISFIDLQNKKIICGEDFKIEVLKDGELVTN